MPSLGMVAEDPHYLVAGSVFAVRMANAFQLLVLRAAELQETQHLMLGWV